LDNVESGSIKEKFNLAGDGYLLVTIQRGKQFTVNTEL